MDHQQNQHKLTRVYSHSRKHQDAGGGEPVIKQEEEEPFLYAVHRN
ncbi:hypothetical protein JMUB7504_27140 [Staphylococcus aureus]